MKPGKAFLLSAFCLIVFSIHAEDTTFQTNQNDVNVPQGGKAAGFDLKEFFLTNFTDPNKYLIELVLVFFAIIYTTNYFVGKRLNEKYALLFVQENRSLFENEFAHVGVSNVPGGPMLDAESANSFKYYASGRLNIVHTLVSIELKKRQDLLSMFVFNLIWPEKDRLRIEIPIDTPVPLPFVFAIARRRDAKTFQQNNPEIKKFCRKIPCETIAKQYTVLAENEETSDFILSPPVISALKKYEGIIEIITFTDLKQPYKQFLRADLILNQDLLRDPKEIQPILKTLFNLADYVTHYKMSANCRARAEKERQAYEASKAKENLKEKSEEIQKKLQEKKKEEAGTKKKDEKKEELKQKKKMQRKFVKMA